MPTEGRGGTSVARRPSSVLVAEVYDAARLAGSAAIDFYRLAAAGCEDRQDATAAAWKLCKAAPAFIAMLDEAGADEFVDFFGTQVANCRPVTHDGHTAATWLEWVLGLQVGLAETLRSCCRGYRLVSLEGEDDLVPFDFTPKEIMAHWGAVIARFENVSVEADAAFMAAGLVQELRLIQARLDQPASPTTQVAQYVFRRTNGQWKVHFGDEQATLPDRAGMEPIRRILGWRTTQTSEEAMTLENPAANVELAPRGLEHVDVQELDGMIESLKCQLASASGKSEEECLEEQLDQLQLERRRRTNIRGKSRVVGDERAKAVDRVHRAITRKKGAIDHIALHCPKLADYLRAIGRAGTEITFSPNARYDWTL